MPHALVALVQKQHPIARRLLDHLRVHVVSLGEFVLVFCILAADQAREIGLLVGALAGEFVDCEGGWNGGEGDVEAGL